MKTYEAHPFYNVRINENKSIQFDFFGVYRTEDNEEIAVLDSLCPTYVKCVDETEEKPKRRTSEK